MSEASDLIDKWESETNSRATDAGSMAQAGLVGELARLMGKSTHDERDDLAAGILLTPSPESIEAERRKEAMAKFFLASLGVDLGE